jgi:formiminoglutamate deiminase
VTTYWAADAHLPTGPACRVRLSVSAGRFTAVESGVEPQPTDERIGGVVLPGLANAHSHAFHRALRGRTHTSGGDFWTWRRQMYAVAARLDPDRYLALARALYAEMALAGITVVGEFHYLHHGPGGVPYADPNAMGAALVQAAADAGIRLTLLDTCYLHGGLESGPAEGRNVRGHLPLDEVQVRFADDDVDAWSARMALLTDSELVRIGAAAHSVRALTGAELQRLGERWPSGPLHVHLSEQPAENAATQSHFGCSPTELLERTGLLGPRTTAVHATHLSVGDTALLGRTATASCFCPTTERDLADGLGPAQALWDAGSPLCLGSDSHAVVDPFEELRGLELHERLASGRRGRFTPTALLDAASHHGYGSLGWPDGGELRVGALADFVSVRAQTVRTAGCSPDQICYAATGADVDRVVVGGRTVVADGQHFLGDAGRMLADAIDGLSRP